MSQKCCCLFDWAQELHTLTSKKSCSNKPLFAILILGNVFYITKLCIPITSCEKVGEKYGTLRYWISPSSQPHRYLTHQSSSPVTALCKSYIYIYITAKLLGYNDHKCMLLQIQGSLYMWDTLIKKFQAQLSSINSFTIHQSASWTSVCSPWYTSTFAAICWQLFGSELDNSHHMAAYELMCVGQQTSVCTSSLKLGGLVRGLMDDKCVWKFLYSNYPISKCMHRSWNCSNLHSWSF